MIVENFLLMALTKLRLLTNNGNKKTKQKMPLME